MRNSLKAFIENHEQGVYWLRAPAHIGKSIFVHGLRMERKPLLYGLKVVSFHIQREYRYEPAQFENYLSRQLEETLDLTAVRQQLPQLDLNHPQPAQALSDWLSVFLLIYQQVHHCPEDKLLLCLDGLDELNQAESRTLLDFIPTSAQLATGCYILLSSRPQEGCPNWIWQHLESQLNDITTQDISLNTPEYRAILRQFVDLAVKERFQAELHRACQNLWQQQLPTVEQVNPLVPTNLRQLVQNELKAQQSQPVIKNQKLAEQFYQTVVLPIIEEFEQSFTQILERSEGRFLYVSFLCNLLKCEHHQCNYDLELADIEHLPTGSNLYQHYLAQIQQVLAKKQWETIKRILLILVACQQAAAKNFNLLTGSKSELDWQGISLEVLASLLGEEDIKSAKFIFALYSLKEILRVERGRGDKAHYRLDIKEFSSHLQQHWRDELLQEHQSLAATFHNDWQGRYEELDTIKAGTAYRLRHLLAHTELSANAELKQAVWGDEALADAYIGQGNQAYEERSDFAAAVAWHTCAMRIYERLLAETGRKSLQNDLAAAYMNRGVALDNQGELAKAVADYGEAIQFQENLLFIQNFIVVVPNLATAFYNLLLLGQQENLPNEYQPEEWRKQAISFLQRLEQMLDISRLPQQWLDKVEYLRRLLSES